MSSQLCLTCLATDHGSGTCPMRGRSIFDSFLNTTYLLTGTLSKTGINTDRQPLAERVAADIWDITGGLHDFHPQSELPGPKPEDMDRYDVAYAQALKKCPHSNLVNTMYQREWQCMDCRRYFDRQTKPRSMWDYFG